VINSVAYQPLVRGETVIVLDYKRHRLQRRVWEDVSPGVLLCSEASYYEAVKHDEEPLFVGFPKVDVVEIVVRSDKGSRKYDSK